MPFRQTEPRTHSAKEALPIDALDKRDDGLAARGRLLQKHELEDALVEGGGRGGGHFQAGALHRSRAANSQTDKKKMNTYNAQIRGRSPESYA